MAPRFSLSEPPCRDAVIRTKRGKMENLPETPKKELIVKRISASKFEVYDAADLPHEKPEVEKPKQEEKPPLMARKSVIQRAPPAPRDEFDNLPPNKRMRVDATPGGVILIKDAIMYRIVDILMWKVMGEAQLRNFGYPVSSTCQVLWRVVCHNQNLGARKMQAEYLDKTLITFYYPDRVCHVCHKLRIPGRTNPSFSLLVFYQQNPRGFVIHPHPTHFFMSDYNISPRGNSINKKYFTDHDCGGNVACFANHVYQFLEICAPNLWKRTGWGRLPVEELLRRIYYEDLIPYLRSVHIKNNINVLQCHSDIVLLEKWEKQKFTAVTWTGQKYFSQVAVNCPRCPQCSNRHF